MLRAWLITILALASQLGCNPTSPPQLSATSPTQQGLTSSLLHADAILGQVVTDGSASPLVDSQSLSGPSALALIDHHLVVIDSGNARVLGYRATVSDNGTVSVANQASVILGQRDFFHTDGSGVDASERIAPEKLAVSPTGRLFVSGRDGQGQSAVRAYDNPFEHDNLSDDVIASVPSSVVAMTVLDSGLLLLAGGSSQNSESLYFYDPAELSAPPYQQLTTPSPCNDRGGIQGATQISSYLLVACPDAVMVATFEGIPGLLMRHQDSDSVAWNTVYEGISAARGLDGVIASEDLNELFVVESGSHRVVPLRNPNFHIQSVLAETRGTYNIALEFSEFIGQPSPDGTTANNHPNLDAAGSPSEFGLSSPSALAWREGYVWIADRDNHRVLRFSTEEIAGELPASASAVIGQSDAFHSYPNRVDGRSILAVSDLLIMEPAAASNAEALWIVDREAHRVLIHDNVRTISDGQSAQDARGQIGLLDYQPNRGTEASPQSLHSPSCIGASQGSTKVAVCDAGNNRISIFGSPDSSRAGALIEGPIVELSDPPSRHPLYFTSVALAETNPPDGEPSLLAFVAAGDAQDGRANRVLIYDLSSVVLDEESPPIIDTPRRVIGQPFPEWNANPTFPANTCNQGAGSPGADTLCDVNKILIDTTNNLWLTDSGNNRILFFETPALDAHGVLFGQEGLLDNLSADLVLGQASFHDRSSWDGSEASAATALSAPHGLAIAAGTGELWVSEPSTGRVLRFSPPFIPGEVAQADTSLGRAQNMGAILDTADIISPISIATSRLGDVVVVADTATNRVLRYSFNLPPAIVVGDGSHSYEVEQGAIGEPVEIRFTDPEGDGIIFDSEAVRANLPDQVSLYEANGGWQLRVDATELIAGQQMYATLWVYDTSPRANRSETLVAFRITTPGEQAPETESEAEGEPATERAALNREENGCQSTESPLISALLLSILLLRSRRRVFV